ncbi:MAG TPA: EAL domain-containing protein [Stellaceae bacterium]|jgi:EAL domain-containing protein (putative c-di-GMP-specific phosphodiesterase class I)/GGDEF domain-containing protein|nr:EAL domain-containing protein [Stellaceae bacterium]
MTPELARFIAEIPAAVALFDCDLRYVAASKAWLAAFGLCAVPLAGQRHDEICNLASATLPIRLRLACNGESIEEETGDEVAFSVRPYRDPGGRIIGAVAALTSGTTSPPPPQAPEPQSDIATPEAFAQCLRNSLTRPDASASAPGIAVFAIHLGNLRNIGNLHGMAVGEQACRVTAERLLAALRSRFSGDEGAAMGRDGDIVARLGPDQFVVTCGAPAPVHSEIEALATRLLRTVQDPIVIGGRALRLTPSIGFVIAGDEHHSTNRLLRDLDLALQQAESIGPGRVVAWEPALTSAATRRYTLGEQVRRAFDNGEFVLRYQPIVRLCDERMVAAEALLRWNQPSNGLAEPATFLPMLDETGLTAELGCWVVRKTINQVESWRLLYGRNIVDWISVNLSAHQFHDLAPLLATVRGLHRGGLPVHRLKFDIAETTLMRRPEISRATLVEFAELGVRVAIDDFGTGHSSPTGLQPLPIDAIKIDGDFIAQTGTSEGNRLVRALIDLAQLYNTTIIAEGVETAEQRDVLRGAGCNLAQGYLFAQPMSGAKFGAYALIHAANADRPVIRQRLNG